jgi:hypothetical protein
LLPLSVLQFYVRHGQQVFRDEVVWDVGNPVNGAEAYAVRVCADLNLGADWFDAIRAHVAQQLDDVRQVGQVCRWGGRGVAGCWRGWGGGRQAERGGRWGVGGGGEGTADIVVCDVWWPVGGGFWCAVCHTDCRCV